MSLIKSTPFLIASNITSPFEESIETMASMFFISSKIGISLSSSSATEIRDALGREDSAPISMNAAPPLSIFSISFKTLFLSIFRVFGQINFPPSEKESGVKFITPITFGTSKLSSFLEKSILSKFGLQGLKSKVCW